MPKVSCIVSAYYAEKFLEGRLQNLAEQEVEGGHEVIVVCQKDSPEFKIVRDWVMTDGNMPVVPRYTDDIPTVYEAWNLGIEVADGEFVTNCNSDDHHYPGALQTLATALDSHPGYGVAYFDVDRVKGKLEGEVFDTFRWAEGGLPELLRGCFIGPMPMWRKSLHDKYGLFDGKYKSAGDYEFWMRLAFNGVQFYHVRSKPLGLHLEHEQALEHRHVNLSIIEQARAKRPYRKEMP